ncbi:MAG: hypothetical protein J0I92_06450 [Phyllobacterium sp.]|nr:hypothetical protein [Phyllobacterium sp.]ODT12454.1 MAG: hypothetical protein ABS57_21910 [Mesorhizobium sp. SCN 65-12]
MNRRDKTARDMAKDPMIRASGDLRRISCDLFPDCHCTEDCHDATSPSAPAPRRFLAILMVVMAIAGMVALYLGLRP